MTIFEAAVEVAAFLDNQLIPYAVLGGLAVQHWGEPRTTLDVDIVVMVPSDREEEFLRTALKRFKPRLSYAFSFAKRHRILLLSTSDGTPVDLSMGIPGYEEEVMHRARKISLAGHPSVKVVSAEGLIIHKCVAGRPRDIEDIERILIRQKMKLDLRYLRRWLRDFSAIVEGHDVRGIFESAVKKVRSMLRRKSTR